MPDQDRLDLVAAEHHDGPFDRGPQTLLVTAQGTLSPPVGNGNITGQTVTAGFGDSLIRAADGGDYRGWAWTTALRVSW